MSHLENGMAITFYNEMKVFICFRFSALYSFTEHILHTFLKQNPMSAQRNPCEYSPAGVQGGKEEPGVHGRLPAGGEGDQGLCEGKQ